MSVWSVFQRPAEPPLTIIDRTVNAPARKVNASAPKVNAPAALKPLHAWSSAKDVAARATLIRPGQWKVTLPAGYMRPIEDVYTELQLLTIAFMTTGNWPTPPAKPAPAPEPTPEEREESWVRKQIEA